MVVSNHRCHGHFLAYGGDPTALFAELMGKPGGVCGGVGGSQHLHWRNFYSQRHPGRHPGDGRRDGLCRKAGRPKRHRF